MLFIGCASAFPRKSLEQDMDYKTVMVSLALDRPNESCLAVAGDLAERFGARIIGVAAADLRPPMYFAEGGFAQKLLDEEVAAIQKRLSGLEEEFRASVGKRAKTVEWRSARSLPAPYMLQQARAADILVVGARTEALVDTGAAVDPGDLVMQAGRPVLVVPPSAQGLDLRSLLVAWKDVREARRAVFDALPLLAAAKEVTITEIPEQGTPRVDALSRVADVAAWLSAHGIVTDTVVPEAGTGTVERLDRVAADVGAGAVIAGAYGHSRLREWILGGVTRHLATESRRCVFLSH
jgi:nucleotide-binding universal stress UspA family protein